MRYETGDAVFVSLPHTLEREQGAPEGIPLGISLSFLLWRQSAVYFTAARYHFQVTPVPPLAIRVIFVSLTICASLAKGGGFSVRLAGCWGVSNLSQ